MEKRLRIIHGLTHESILNRILDDIKRRASVLEENLDVGHLVIVPDRFTLSVENMILDGEDTGGLMDVEVVTLNRLYNRLCSHKPFLDKSAACILIQRFLKESKNFQSSSPEFAEQIYDTIMQLKACNIKPHELNTKSRGLAKFLGLREVYESYEKHLKDEGMVDSSDKLYLLANSVSALSQKHVYFALYDALTAQHFAILDKMSIHCLSVSVGALNGLNRALFSNDVFSSLIKVWKGREKEVEKIEASEENFFTKSLLLNAYQRTTFLGKANNVRMFKFQSKEAEIDSAVMSILHHVHNGLAFEDIAILCGEIDQAVLSEVLTAYNIPHFLDNPKILLNHPLMRLVCSMLEASQNRTPVNVETLLLSPYLKIPRSSREEFINYTRMRSIRYDGYDREFSSAVAEQVRVVLMGVLERAYSIASIKEFIEQLQGESEELEIENQARAFKEVYRLLDLAQSMLKMSRLSSKDKQELLAALRAGALVRLTALPPSASSVYIGVGQNFRGVRHKLLLVLGANLGALPLEKKDAGLITDKDMENLRRELEPVSKSIEPMIREVNTRARYEFMHALTTADKVIISYNAKPSQALSYLSSLFEVAEVSGEEMEKERKKLPSYIDFAYPTKQSLRRGVAKAYASVYRREGKDDIDDAIEAVLNEPHLFTVSESQPIDGNSLFFDKGKKTSASKLESFFACPYQHFLSSGLRLKELREEGLTFLNIGTAIHKVAETLHNNGYKTPTEKYVLDIIDSELGLKTIPEEQSSTLRRLLNSCLRMCKELIEHRRLSEYQTVEVEKKVLTSIGSVLLDGKIDRIDRHNEFVRIIDYKSGNPKIDLKDVYYGRKLQLFLYLQALLEEGEGLRIGGVYYYPLADSFEKTASASLNGFTVENIGELLAMDASHVVKLDADPALLKGETIEKIEKLLSEDSKRDSKEYFLEKSMIIGTKLRFDSKKKQLLRNRTCGRVLEESDLLEMCRYVCRLCEKAVEQMAAGEIGRLPKADGCSYCPAREGCTPKRERKDTTVASTSFQPKTEVV